LKKPLILVKFTLVAHPEWYPPQNGAGAHQQAVKFEFWENHIAAYTPPTETYNVTLGCNDSNAWAGYNGEIPFFDNSLCTTGGTIENFINYPVPTTTTTPPQGQYTYSVLRNRYLLPFLLRAACFPTRC
jgi:hypothetical protein